MHMHVHQRFKYMGKTQHQNPKNEHLKNIIF
jgi:hypothetical protein